MQVRENDPTAPTPYTNRLALSQAWYDALHLARDRAPHAAQAGRAVAAGPATAPRAAAPAAPGNPAGGYRVGNATLRAPRALVREDVVGDAARAVARAERRRRVVRVLRAPAASASPRAIVIGAGSHVAVRIAFSPHGLIIALAAAPEHRPRAADALERARLALAARGIATVRSLS